MLSLGTLSLGSLGIVALSTISRPFGMDRFLFHPNLNLHTSPRSLGLEYENVNIFYASQNSIKYIHGWFIPRKEHSQHLPHYVICFFHGNAGNISDRMDFLKMVSEYLPNCSVLLWDYIGYGLSGSSDVRPNLTDCLESSWQALHWLNSEKHMTWDQIVVWGESIGGALATRVITERSIPVAGIVLQGTFTSLKDIVQHTTGLPWWSGIRFLVSRDLTPLQDLQKLRAVCPVPVLVLHSPDDEIVPYTMAERLTSVCNHLIDLSGSHNNSVISHAQAIKDALHQFVFKPSSMSRILGSAFVS